jgi:hypothetical protein
MSQEMFYAAADVSVDERRRQWLEIEVRARMVHRIGQILSGIRERTVQIEHHQVDGSFHFIQTL